MAFCTHCGNSLPEGTKFCTGCGAAQTPAEPSPQSAPVAPPPASHPLPPPYAYPAHVRPPYVEEPISTGSYIGIFFLLMIPLLNLLCVLIWACGGCNKRNLTNLSRAMLVWMLIGMVISFLLMLAGGLLFGEYFNELKGSLDELQKMTEQYQH